VLVSWGEPYFFRADFISSLQSMLQPNDIAQIRIPSNSENRIVHFRSQWPKETGIA
jgi:hypothetical protein